MDFYWRLANRKILCRIELSSRTLLASLVIVTVFLLGTAFVAAQQPQYSGPGGEISGTVIGFGHVFDWAQINAVGGNQTFEAFSGFSGFYLMRVPAGTYKVSVYDPYNPQYSAPSVNVTVTDGSYSTVNFYLQLQPPVAVPEFQPNLAGLVVALTLGAACTLSRRLRR